MARPGQSAGAIYQRLHCVLTAEYIRGLDHVAVTVLENEADVEDAYTLEEKQGFGSTRYVHLA